MQTSSTVAPDPDGVAREQASPHAARSPQQPLARTDFKIAVICALPHESSAVRAVFDETWDSSRYGKALNDSNTYTLGRIGQLNVVLAYLPGIGGPATAALTAHVLHSFPSIGLVLVVGICGGAPFGENKRPISLGDVIISTSIVQYAYGRRFPDRLRKKDTLIDSLSRPNQEIRGFLHMLATIPERKLLRQRMLQSLERILEDKDYADWKRPSEETNKLFNASYRHKHQKQGECLTCDQCINDRDEVCDYALRATCLELGCSDSESETRSGTLPRVHFGKIASADQVMKSAIDRDLLVKEDDVIAIEMEGAGAWDNIPTIIIKSVCDFADTHKNKDWQKYACAAAASCMKAFIHAWRSANLARWPYTTDSIACAQQDQDQTKKLVDALWFREIADRFDGVERAQFESFRWVFHQEENHLFRYMSSDKGRDTWRIDQSLSSPLFTYMKNFQLGMVFEWDPCGLKTWLRDGEGIFWITGKPGCGKSTFMKLIYEDTQYMQLLRQWAPGHTLLTPSFFFWRAGSEMQKSYLGLLQSMLYQILKSHPELVTRVLEPVEQEDILRMNEAKQSTTRALWTVDRVQRMFRNIICLEKVKTCILIDGLDEMKIQYSHVADYLMELTKNRNVKILVSGRLISEFSGSFYGCTTIHLHEWTKHDAEVYVRGRLLEKQFLREQAQFYQKDFENFIRNILSKAEGVFIWIKTAVTALIEGIYRSDNLIELAKTLDELPKEIDDLYETILNSLDRSYESQSKFLLSLILATNRYNGRASGPIISLAAQYDQTIPDWVLRQSSKKNASFKELQSWTKRRLESRCSQFVSFRYDTYSSSWVVDFMHKTVFDFLESRKIRKWLSAGSPDPSFYRTAICMAEFTSGLIGVGAPSRSLFMSKILSCGLDWTEADVRITDFAVLALRQLETATFKWFENDAAFPLVSPVELDPPLGEERYVCEYLGAFYLIDIWSKYENSQRHVAFICLMLYGELAETARKYLKTNPCKLTTKSRVDMLTISTFSRSKNLAISSLIEDFCYQDPACTKAYWERIILMLSCQANVPPGGHRYADELFFAPNFAAAVESLLRVGADPNMLVQCSPAGLQRIVLQSPLRVFRRCEASAQTIETVYKSKHGWTGMEAIHVQEISSIIKTLLRYKAVEVETASSATAQKLEEVKLMAYLTDCGLPEEKPEAGDEDWEVVSYWAQEDLAEPILEQGKFYEADMSEQAEEAELDIILDSVGKEGALLEQYKEHEEAFLEYYSGMYYEGKAEEQGDFYEANMSEQAEEAELDIILDSVGKEGALLKQYKEHEEAFLEYYSGMYYKGIGRNEKQRSKIQTSPSFRKAMDCCTLKLADLDYIISVD